MASLSNYKSNFSSTSVIDLMSSIGIPSSQTDGSQSGYMYIGQLLINFSVNQIVNNNNITFPKSFNSLYGIVCTSTGNDTASAQNPSTTGFKLVAQNYCYYIAWGI